MICQKSYQNREKPTKNANSAKKSTKIMLFYKIYLKSNIDLQDFPMILQDFFGIYKICIGIYKISCKFTRFPYEFTRFP